MLRGGAAGERARWLRALPAASCLKARDCGLCSKSFRLSLCENHSRAVPELRADDDCSRDVPSRVPVQPVSFCHF